MNFGADGGAHNKNRAVGLSFVVGFHILLIWGLLAGLSRTDMTLLPPPIETKIIEDIVPPAEEPPPPKPEFEPPPPPFVPPPDIFISAPAAPTTAITQTTNVKAPPPKKQPRVAAKIDLKGSPRACREPEYPAASERLGEAGVSGISLLIGVDGKVQQSKIDTTSGHKRLDDAAIKAFSRCKFIVGTNNGVAEASWFSINYRWVVPK